MSDKRGACREQAENRLYRLDPKPDLDNANVGIYRTQHIFFVLSFYGYVRTDMSVFFFQALCMAAPPLIHDQNFKCTIKEKE